MVDVARFRLVCLKILRNPRCNSRGFFVTFARCEYFAAPLFMLYRLQRALEYKWDFVSILILSRPNRIFQDFSMTTDLSQLRDRRKGFTLVELLVVIAIIGILVLALCYLRFKRCARRRGARSARRTCITRCAGGTQL